MLKNIIANIIGKFWSLFSVFIFVPLYIVFLGFESYSVISFTLVIAGLMAILDAGLTATLSREFARKDKTNSDKRNILGTLETIYIVLVAFVIALVFLFSNTIATNWLKVSGISISELSLFLKLVSFEVGFQMLFRFYLGGLLGLEYQVAANVIQISWGVVRNGLVVLLIYFFPTLEAYFIWQAISTALFTIILKYILQKKLIGYGSLKFYFYVNKSILNDVSGFAGGMLLISIVAAINTQLDKLTISKLLSIESLGYYTLGVSLATSFIVLVNPISVALLPRFTALYSERKNAKASRLFLLVNLITSIIIFSFMANMTFFSKEILWIWTGKKELAEKVSSILPILGMSYAMLSLAIIPYNIAIANGYTKLNNILGILSIFITIPGYYMAIRDYGILGAALVFLIVQSIITLLYYYFINKKFIASDLFTLFGRKLFFPMIVTLVIAFCIYSIPINIWDNRFFSLAWIGLSTLVTFSFTSILFLKKETINQVLRIVTIRFGNKLK